MSRILNRVINFIHEELFVLKRKASLKKPSISTVPLNCKVAKVASLLGDTDPDQDHPKGTQPKRNTIYKYLHPAL